MDGTPSSPWSTAALLLGSSEYIPYTFLYSRLNCRDLYRREGKGRGCYLGDRIYSIPSRASYFAPERFEEWDEFVVR